MSKHTCIFGYIADGIGSVKLVRRRTNLVTEEYNCWKYPCWPRRPARFTYCPDCGKALSK